MSRPLPERLRYAADNKNYACVDPKCKAHHDAEYLRMDLHESALADAQQKERRAAIAALTGLPAQGTMNYRRGYEEGVRDAIRTLEAAANDQKAPRGERP